MIRIYGTIYLNRSPEKSELQSPQDSYEVLRFPVCVGPVDFCNVSFNNLLFLLDGQFLSKKQGNLETIRFESCFDHYFNICNWFPVLYGKNKDNTILSMSPLF